ncbi:hypothetical protein AAC387_Pa07g1503 [Persea americana]
MAAAIGVSSYPCSKTLTASNPKSNQSRRIATPFLRSSNGRLSSSSSSILYGDKLHTRAVFRKQTQTAFGSRTPVTVSPKAVSDSQNSQTCPDPDASKLWRFPPRTPGKYSPSLHWQIGGHLLFGAGQSTATLRDITFNQAWKLNAAKAKKKNRPGLS